MYKLTDLIDKLIKVEELGADLYIKKSENIQGHENIKILAKVFSNQEKKHIKIYEKLKQNISIYDDITVEFDIYDKASKLVYEFLKLQVCKDVEEIKDLLELALMFEKENLALIKSIRGLFVKASDYIETKNYKILSEIIEQEEEHVSEIEKLLINIIY